MYEIKMWPPGDDIMEQVDLSIIAEKYQIITLVDRNLGSERTRRFMHRCGELNIPVTRFKRYAIENCFLFSAFRTVLKERFTEEDYISKDA